MESKTYIESRTYIGSKTYIESKTYIKFCISRKIFRLKGKGWIEMRTSNFGLN